MTPGYAHFAAPIVPGQVYEVRPGKELMATGEVYFAKVAAQPDGAAKVEVFALSTWSGKVEKAVAPCRNG